MDNKRVILATVLSMAVLLGWTYFFPAAQNAPQTEETAAVEQQAAQPAAAGEAQPLAAETIPTELFKVGEGKPVSVSTPLYRAELSTQGGVLVHYTLNNYKETIEKGSPSIDLVDPRAAIKAPMGLIYNGTPSWQKGAWAFEGGDLNLSGQDEGVLRFVGKVNGVTLVRELTFHADSYVIDETVRVQNTSAAQVQSRLAFTLASTGLTPEDDRYNLTRVAYLGAEGLEEESDTDELGQGVQSAEGLKWGGVQSNYFLLALAPQVDGAAFKARYTDKIYRIAVEKDGLLIDPGMEAVVGNAYYLGPKEENALAGAPNGLDKAIDFGFFTFLAKPLLIVLNMFYDWVGNYGVAIILLTVCIKALFWPLSQKSYKSMGQMRKIQPMMTAIREKYKDDRERMNQEMMQLYKTYKVNPAGGCLPMLIQIPVFFGLYQALLNAIELRHAPFIAHVPFTELTWLADLSAKDPYYVTPIVMGATMFLQQKLTPSPGDPTQAKIMLFMPLIFTFMFLNFPSGLVVYWLVNNVLSIAQQSWMLRKS